MSQRKNPESPKAATSNDRVLSRFLALEPRVLLDAAAVETAAHVLDGSAPGHGESTAASDAIMSALLAGGVSVSPLPAAGGAREILFIDSGVQNYEALIRNVGPGVEVFILQGSDWASQMQSALGQRDGDVTAVHLVSHGGAGRLTLGGETVDAQSLEQYSRVWASLRQALTPDGDLLIYGCDVAAGAEGVRFVNALASSTGADVAASEDLSGVAALGADWNLEVSSGAVTARSLFADGADNDFMGVLADGFVQDGEVNSANAATAVAITRTTNGNDWKFVGRAAANAVDVYLRNASNGNWALSTTLTGATYGNGNFGWDVAAASNKLVVSAPTWDNGNNDGRVVIFTYNGTNWTTLVQNINCRPIAGSGRTGVNGGSSDINDIRGAGEQFGYSVDIATDSAGNYKLIVGNPYEDWFDWDNDDNDGTWGGNAVDYNVRADAGAAWVFQALGGTHGNFADDATVITVVSQQGGTTGNGHYFGGATAIGYDFDSAKWWFAVGNDGTNQARMYGGTAAGSVINGATYTQALAWDSAGNNDLSMDDDYLAIANAASVQAYKLDAASTAWSAKGAAFGAGGSVVYVDDQDQSAAGDTTDGVRIMYSGTSGTSVTAAIQYTSAVPSWTVVGSVINTVQEVAVAIDRYRGMDVLTASSTGTRSYHYSWEPVLTNDSNTGTEDANIVTTVVTGADTDLNISGTPPADSGFTNSPYGMFGDTLTVSAVGASAYGATVTFSGTQVTYNPTTSTYLQSLALGQSISENITVTVQDGQGKTSTQTLSITINGVNDTPTANSLVAIVPYATQQSGSTSPYDFTAYFDDVDAGEDAQLAPSATALPGGWSAVTDGIYLRLTIPQGTAAGDYVITVRVQDPQSSFSATKNFTIRVDATNNAPVVQTPLPDQVALAGYEYEYTLPQTTFNDPDPRPYDNLTYTATLSSGAALPAWLTWDAANRRLSGTPAAGDVGTITVRITATDDAASKGRGANLSVFDDYQLIVANPAPKTLTSFTDGPSANADFGFSCAISENGNALVVGSPGNNSLYYYYWNVSTWTYVGSITGPVANAKFGWSVDLSDDGLKLVVGARNEQIGANLGQGAVYMYTRASVSSTFSTAANTYGKSVASGGLSNDYYGTAVAINEAGNNVIIGASHFDYSTYSDSGAAFWIGFQTTNSGNNAAVANVLPKDPSDFNRFGTAVGFDQNIIVVTAVGDDNPSGMVTRLEFDDGAGTYTSPDFGSVGGTLSSATQFADDPDRDGVIYLTGTDGKVTLDSAIDLSTSWTISTWYKGLPTVTAGSGVWRTLTRGSSDHQVIIRDDGLIGVYDNAGGTGFVATNTAFDMDTLNNSLWHHIAAVGEGGTTKIYIDGALVGTVLTEQATDDIVVVGNYQGNGQRFADYMDDFRVYDRALSQSEIRNIKSGVDTADAPFADAGAIYVWSTDTNTQVAKLYAPEHLTGDLLGWAVDVDIYDYASVSRNGGIIVASSIFSDTAATDGGAVYVWRSTSQATGQVDNNGSNGNGTWRLEAVITSFDTTANDYFGNDVAVDYDESTGGTRLLVGAPFEDGSGAYSGAVYAYKHVSGSWLPEKFTDASPQGGSLTVNEFFGSSVAIADTRAVMGARWRDNGGQTNDGSIFWANLQTQGNYATVLSAEAGAGDTFFLPADLSTVVSIDTTGTQGEVSFNEDGQLVYNGGTAFKSLGIGQTATDSFTYVTEIGGVTYTNTVNLTVMGTDDPTILRDDFVEVSASAGATIVDVLANDEDPDAPAPLTILSVASSGVTGSLQLTDAGLVFDPSGSFDALRAGEKVQQTLTYTVLDSNGVERTATVTLVVVGEDDPVTAVNDSVTTQADAPVTVNVLANDLDDDGHDTISVAYVDSSGSGGSVVLNGDGTITYLPGDAFKYLKAGETAIDKVVYVVRDESGNESAAELTVLVIGVDDVPVAQDDGVYADPGEVVAIDALANDVDPDGDALQVTRVITTGTIGQVTLNADGTFSYTAPTGAVTADSFSYEVADALGNTSMATVYINQDGGRPVEPELPVAQNDTGVAPNLDAGLIPVTSNDGGGTIIAVSQTSLGVATIQADGIWYAPDSASLEKLPAGRVATESFTYTVQYADGRTSTATVTIYFNGTFVSPLLEEEDERFALPSGSYYTESALEPITAAVSPQVVEAPEDAVANLALDALVEMADEDSAAAGDPLAAVTDKAVKPVETARPTLSVMLGRETMAKRAGVDALLKHFSESAA